MFNNAKHLIVKYIKKKIYLVFKNNYININP